MTTATQSPHNIASYLPKLALSQPDTMVVIFPHGTTADDSAASVSIENYPQYTFGQLNEISDQLACGFEQIGIRKNVRTVLMVRPSLDFFAITFALFKIGATMVCVDPGIGIKNLGKCLAQSQPQAFIGIPQAHWARRLFGWAKKTLQTNVLVGGKKWLPTSMHRLESIRRLGERLGETENLETEKLFNTSADDEAAILFTSGSTGVPKGVVYTHGNFQAQVEMLRSRFGIEAGEVDLCTFPLFALFAPALGMSAVIPEMDFTKPGSVNPKKIIAAIKQLQVTNMFGSPALLNRVGRWTEKHNVKLPSLRRVISAGAPVQAPIIRRFCKALSEGVEVFTPYGATESLPVAVIGSDEILKNTAKLTDEGNGICVGKPVENIEVCVIKISDKPISHWSDELLQIAGEIGEIVVKGPVVTEEYYNNPKQTELAKIKDQSGGFYHRMGDLGYYDHHGRLWFCGRKSHRVVTANLTYFTVPCEGIYNTHEKVYRTALINVNCPNSNTNMPGICVELHPEHKIVSRETISEELKQIGIKYQQTAGIENFYLVPKFPVDIRHNSKINRELLSRKYGGTR